MNIWQVVVLAVVEGITEFLPISSTAHLMLAANMLRITQTEFVKSFEIAIQLGAICSVAVLYAQKILKNPGLMGKILVAFLPTGIAGAFLYKYVKSYLIGNNVLAILMLFLGGILLLKFEILNSKFENKLAISQLSITKLLLIGLFQSISMIPGVSRALSTIWGGQMAGLSRAEAVEMSFLLAIPTMAAATGLDLLKSGANFSNNEWFLLGAGFAGAFFSAAMVIKWLVEYVKQHDFRIFGWYRIVLGIGWGAGLLISYR